MIFLLSVCCAKRALLGQFSTKATSVIGLHFFCRVTWEMHFHIGMEVVLKQTLSKRLFFLALKIKKFSVVFPENLSVILTLCMLQGSLNSRRVVVMHTRGMTTPAARECD